ncbi:MAG: Ig-like domain-containing protein [Lachnospiraceae bacterium]|nr:Ig-like domain-containing protein [Lachnospiraceae bacterium]
MINRINRRWVFIFFVLIACFCGVISNSHSVSAKKKKVKLIKSIKLRKYNGVTTLRRGKKVALKYTIKPANATNKKLKFKSSAPNIVYVNKKGIIRTRNYGYANIIAKTTDGSKKKVKLRVYVGNSIKSFAFSNPATDSVIYMGKSKRLIPVFNPTRVACSNLKFESSNTNVATVTSKGLIKPISNGDVTITATTKDGTNKRLRRVFTIKTLVTSVSLNAKETNKNIVGLGSSGVYIRKGENCNLIPNITPETASDKSLTFKSNNSLIASVNNDGVLTAKNVGICTITATCNDVSSMSTTFTVQVTSNVKPEVFLIAHRGRSAMAPENSLAAFKLGFEGLFDAVECDIWKTTDDEFCISHDESLLRCCNVDKLVTNMTLDEVKSTLITKGSNIKDYPNLHVPSLDQLIELKKNYPGKILLIELKQKFSRGNLKKIIKKTVDAGIYKDVRFISFYDENLKIIREIEESFNSGKDTLEPSDSDIPTSGAVTGSAVTDSAIEDINDDEDENIDNTDNVNKSIKNMKNTDSEINEEKEDNTSDSDNIKLDFTLEYLVSKITDDIIEECKTYNFIINSKYSGVTDELINKAHDNDLLVHVWTVPNIMIADRMIYSLKVDGITSNELFYTE